MTDPKPFASLSPTLLARKGGAKPAMRPQLQPLNQFHENAARQLEEDLGWNDMGEHHDTHHDLQLSPMDAKDVAEVAHEDEHADDGAYENTSERAQPVRPAQVVALTPVAPDSEVSAEKPEVVRQQEAIVRSIERPSQPRASALARGRRAAFTLRLDAERHLKLRLACTVTNRSAQQLVTEAVDRLLADMPEVASLAAKVRKHG